MVKANSKVTDLNGVINVYGAERTLRRAFGLSANDWATWQAHGVPRGHHLGLYRGLKAWGAEPACRGGRAQGVKPRASHVRTRDGAHIGPP